MTLDPNDPMVRHAMDRAAQLSEHLLEVTDVEQELALDYLSSYVSEILEYQVTDVEKWLAWSFAITEKRTDLRPNEEKLLEDAWLKIKDDVERCHWEEMGL